VVRYNWDKQKELMKENLIKAVEQIESAVEMIHDSLPVTRISAVELEIPLAQVRGARKYMINVLYTSAVNGVLAVLNALSLLHMNFEYMVAYSESDPSESEQAYRNVIERIEELKTLIPLIDE